VAELRTDEFGFGFFASVLRFNRTNLHIITVRRCWSYSPSCLGVAPWPRRALAGLAVAPGPLFAGLRRSSPNDEVARYSLPPLRGCAAKPVCRSPPPCCHAEDLLRDPHHHRPGAAPPAAAAIGRVRSRRCARAGASAVLHVPCVGIGTWKVGI
jgi:hypothetical protein